MKYYNLQTVKRADSWKDLRVLADIPRFHARVTPDKTALKYEGRNTTYEQLNHYATQVANGLISEDITQQKNIAWLDINSDYFFEMLFGCAKSRTVICPINWRLAAPEIEYIVNNAEAEILFVGERFFEVIETIKDRLTTLKKIVAISGSHPHWENYNSWRDRQSGEDPDINISTQDVAIQMYTSGTTGHPKGVLMSAGSLLTDSTETGGDMGWNNWSSSDVGLLVMPCFHIAGLRWGLMGLHPGSENVIMPEFDPARVVELIAAHGVTRTMLVPAALQFVLQNPACRDVDYSSFKLIWYGGSPIPLDVLKEAMQIFRCDFIQTYGLTETGAQTTYLPPEDHDVNGNERMKSAGKALPGVQIRIESKEGRILPIGEVGEICIKSPANMLGYWKKPEETAKTIINGWMHTGDAGYMDENGYIYIHDRIKDMIVSGGENIYPAEIENVIFSHPALADVAVIGVPDDKWGEAVKAIVVLNKDQDVSADDIIAYVRERIASYKCPKSIDFADSLPRNPSGKILKKDLRAKYWRNKTRMVN